MRTVEKNDSADKLNLLYKIEDHNGNRIGKFKKKVKNQMKHLTPKKKKRK
jgi:hypothetical protein